MPKNMLDGGQVIVDYLVREKVPYVFGLCGHGNIGFLDALYERSDEIKTVSVHHESVAGFMADVYYRVGGKPAATFRPCCVLSTRAISSSCAPIRRAAARRARPMCSKTTIVSSVVDSPGHCRTNSQ